MVNTCKNFIISLLSLGMTLVLMIFIFHYGWNIFTSENNQLLYAFILILLFTVFLLSFGIYRRGIKIKESILLTITFIFLTFVEIMLFFYIKSLGETLIYGDVAIARVITISYEREERVKVEYHLNDKVYKKQAYLPMLSNVRVGDNVEIKYLEQQNNKPIIIKSKIGLFINILLLLFIFLLISLILYAIIVTLFSGE